MADELATVTQSPQRRDARAALNPKSWAAAEVVCHLRDVEEGIQAATTSHTSAQRRQRYRHDSSWRASGHDRGRRRRFAAFGQPDTERSAASVATDACEAKTGWEIRFRMIFFST